MPPGTVDIDKLIDYAAPQDATEKALARLQKETKALPSKFRSRADSTSGEASLPKDFSAWFKSPHRDSDAWKLGWTFNVRLSAARSAVAKAKTEYGVARPVDYITFARGTVKQHDWLLCFAIDDEQLRDFGWLFVDFVVPVSRSDKRAYEKDYPYQAVQVHALSKCPSPPFKITQPFRTAFRRAVRAWGVKRLYERHSLLPTDSLLRETSRLIREQDA